MSLLLKYTQSGFEQHWSTVYYYMVSGVNNKCGTYEEKIEFR